MRFVSKAHAISTRRMLPSRCRTSDSIRRARTWRTGAVSPGPLLAFNIKETRIEEAQTYADKTVNEANAKSAAIVAEAKAYRRTVVESAKANSEYFKKLLPEYRKRPQLVVQNIYRDIIEQVIDGLDEKILIEPTETARGREIRIHINRDPAIKEKESEP